MQICQLQAVRIENLFFNLCHLDRIFLLATVCMHTFEQAFQLSLEMFQVALDNFLSPDRGINYEMMPKVLT